MFLADCLGRCTFVYRPRWQNCDTKYTEMSFYDPMIVNGEFLNPGMGHTGHRRSRDHNGIMRPEILGPGIASFIHSVRFKYEIKTW